MNAKTQEAMRDVSHYIATYFIRGLQKWLAFVKIYTTEMDAKLVFDCLLGAFLFEELLRLDLFTVGNGMIFNGNFERCAAQRKFEFARACCQVLVFILPNKMR